MDGNPYAAKSTSRLHRAALVTAPDGTIKEILAWVSGDPERARIALDKENSGHSRTTLINELEKIINE